MYNLILIVQTFTGAIAYEYGPYPDTQTCEAFSEKYVLEKQAEDQRVKVIGDCRLLNPELQEERLQPGSVGIAP